MNGMILRVGPAWTFRILGLMKLATGIPAAWLIKERCPIKSDKLIEWYLPPTCLFFFSRFSLAIDGIN